MSPSRFPLPPVHVALRREQSDIMSTNPSNNSTNTFSGLPDNDKTADGQTVGTAGTATSVLGSKACKIRPLPKAIREPAKGSIFMPTKETGILADGSTEFLDNWNSHNLT